MDTVALKQAGSSSSIEEGGYISDSVQIKYFVLDFPPTDQRLPRK